MEAFSRNIRSRAQELGISNAEVARRANLTERRYAHYVSGDREPDLATLLRIAHVLHTTPNYLLGFEDDATASEPDGRKLILDRVMVSAEVLNDEQLHFLAAQVEALARMPKAKDPENSAF